ncbi:MAG: cupin domain-containing protein [Haloferacaceae archaeon]
MQVMSGEAAAETEAVEGTHLSQLVAGERMSVQSYRIEPGATVPEHSHPHEQGGLATAGEAVFRVGDEEVRVSAGDAYLIPGGEPHEVESVGDVAFEGVDVFSPAREDPDWGE